MSVVLTPELPVAAWLAQLDGQIARSPKVFEGRPVLLDVSLLAGHEAEIAALVTDLGARGVRVIGIDGSMPHALGPYAAALPAIMNGGRNAQIGGRRHRRPRTPRRHDPRQPGRSRIRHARPNPPRSPPP